MAPPLTHRGIQAEVRSFDGIYAGRLLVAGAIVNFRADERDDVIPAFHAAVDAYLDDPAAFRPPAPAPTPQEAGERPYELRYDTWGHADPSSPRQYHHPAPKAI